MHTSGSGGGLRASGASCVEGCWRAKRAAWEGGAAGRPRIVAEGDVLRVINKWSQNDKRFSKPSKLQTKFLSSQNDKKSKI